MGLEIRQLHFALPEANKKDHVKNRPLFHMVSETLPRLPYQWRLLG